MAEKKTNTTAAVDTRSIYEALALIQSEIKCPKSEDNGTYKSRNLEKMLEENINPVVAKYGCSLVFSDSIQVMNGSTYICAVATLYNQAGEKVSACALAREHYSESGKRPAQITGSCSTYARKYALTGLFAIGAGEVDPDKDTVPQDMVTGGENKPAVQIPPAQAAPAPAAPAPVNVTQNNTTTVVTAGASPAVKVDTASAAAAGQRNPDMSRKKLTPDSANWSENVTKCAKSSRDAVGCRDLIRSKMDITDEHLCLFLLQAGKIACEEEFDEIFNHES